MPKKISLEQAIDELDGKYTFDNLLDEVKDGNISIYLRDSFWEFQVSSDDPLLTHKLEQINPRGYTDDIQLTTNAIRSLRKLNNNDASISLFKNQVMNDVLNEVSAKALLNALGVYYSVSSNTKSDFKKYGIEMVVDAIKNFNIKLFLPIHYHSAPISRKDVYFLKDEIVLHLREKTYTSKPEEKESNDLSAIKNIKFSDGEIKEIKLFISMCKGKITNFNKMALKCTKDNIYYAMKKNTSLFPLINILKEPEKKKLPSVSVFSERWRVDSKYLKINKIAQTTSNSHSNPHFFDELVNSIYYKTSRK